jgi:DNA sulfur modification protein DndB
MFIIKSLLTQNNQEVIGMATYVKLSGTEGTQFGRKFYNITLKFHELQEFLAVFKEVQRNIDREKVISISKYVLKGLREDNMSFLTSITTTCRGDILYNHQKEEVSIDIESILSVNDGQHRFKGIVRAISVLEKELKAEEDKRKKFLISRKLEALKNMQIPVVIFAGITEDMERQLFHDLNQLAKRPTRSVSLKFNQTNLYTRVAKYLATNNEYFTKYGVEMEKTRLTDANPNTFLLSILTNSVSYLLTGTDKSASDDVLNEENYDEVRAYVESTFNKVFEVLPDDLNDHKKYVMNKSAVIQGIARFIYLSKFAGVSEEDILLAIANTDFTINAPWEEFGANRVDGTVTFVGTGTGVNIVTRYIGKQLEALTAQ